MIRAAVLFGLWLGLWGEVTPANIISGVVVVALVLVAFPPDRQMRHRYHPLALLSFVVFILRALVVSSARVALAVIAPTPARTRTEIVDVPLSTDSELVASVMANSITLTPGTMTVEVREVPLTLSVHVFGFGDEASFRAEMADLERRILRATEPREQSA
jgi:multicomponent Na+:H+ antiporter subunit E